MSVMADRNSIAYESTEEEGTSSDKLCLRVYETSGRFVYLPQSEPGFYSSVAERVQGLYNDDDDNDVARPSACYYGSQYTQTTGMLVRHEETSSMFSELKMEEEAYEASAMESSTRTDGNPGVECWHSFNDEADEDRDDSDEETIATFLTAAGQRLALYAVQDSDQFFAVAVYDETGEPPTNFQFLTKSDVERLVGEGAVRTVKKPTQIRKQVLTNEPFPYNFDEPSAAVRATAAASLKDDRLELLEEYEQTYEIEKKPAVETVTTRNVSENIESNESSPLEQLSNVGPLAMKTTIESSVPSSPIAYFDPLDSYEEQDSTEETVDEVIHRSTVDRLLMDDDRSEDELTFADIEETLWYTNHLAPPPPPTPPRRPPPPPPLPISTTPFPCKTEKNYDAEMKMDNSFGYSETSKPDEESLSVVTYYSSIVKSSRKANLVEKKYIGPAGGPSTSLICRRNERNVVDDDNEKWLSSRTQRTTSPKAKRPPRKQQLTLVNRGDSEIIIQAAIFPSQEENEEEEEVEEEEEKRKRKKAHRRKRKPGSTVRYGVSITKRRGGGRRRGETRRDGTGEKPNQQYEIIEIDVEEEDRLGSVEAKSIVEITIDDSREKNSSDKENQVIMVGDSGDDEDEAKKADTPEGGTAAAAAAAADSSSLVTPLLKCQHCSRTFRQKRAVKTHSRLCPNSPKNLSRRSNDATSRVPSDVAAAATPKKQFACKFCEEKFDVVVVLARHVKAMHSLRKKAAADRTPTTPKIKVTKTRKEKGESSSRVLTAEQTATVIADEATTASPPGTTATATTRRRRTRRKRRKNVASSSSGWKGQKLHCSDCGKWFSSAALLASHSLQHATKKSEKQIRRCQTCKKVIKSRLLYIRHMRMHSSKAKKLQKKLRHTRQANVKLASLGKRGTRPRKLS